MNTPKKTGTEITPFPQIAQPTIQQVLERFLDDQTSRLGPRTAARYRAVIGLLQSYLDGYAYQSLDNQESVLFEHHSDATGSSHLSFCQLFGANKIIENIGGFVGYFMIRKVVAGEELKRAAGTVSKKLSRWLEQNNMVDSSAARDAAAKGADAARDLPRAERAALLLADHAVASNLDTEALGEEDYLDFDHFTIVKLEPGRVWLDPSLGGESYGPITIPKEASRLLSDGWEISCALGRVRARWHIVEVGNVYPS
jgi:hypothetical protein